MVDGCKDNACFLSNSFRERRKPGLLSNYDSNYMTQTNLEGMSQQSFGSTSRIYERAISGSLRELTRDLSILLMFSLIVGELEQVLGELAYSSARGRLHCQTTNLYIAPPHGD